MKVYQVGPLSADIKLLSFDTRLGLGLGICKGELIVIDEKFYTTIEIKTKITNLCDKIPTRKTTVHIKTKENGM